MIHLNIVTFRSFLSSLVTDAPYGCPLQKRSKPRALAAAGVGSGAFLERPVIGSRA